MKYQWELDDIKSGMIIENRSTSAENRFYMTGYSVQNENVILFSLDDGNMIINHNKDRLVELLNSGNYAPASKPIMGINLCEILDRK